MNDDSNASDDTEADDTTEILPQVLFLFDLLTWVKQGRVRVPAFQRDYVWSRKDILELFDSVRSAYPIGTLLFWSDPSGAHQGAEPGRLGPLELPKAQGPSMLVLDGQQRLTTLAGVLLFDGKKRASGDRDPGRWQVYYDAQINRFTYLKQGEGPKAWQIPAAALSSTGSMFAAVRDLHSLSTPNVERLVERVQAVARALQSYRLPIVEFRTRNLNLAVESFTRLNKRGVSIGPDEMFSALTYETGAKHGFNVAAEVTNAKNRLEALDFGEVDRLVILRTFLVTADLDPYRTDWKRLGVETQKETATKLPEAMKRATTGLCAAIEFLREEGMRNTRLLPYGLQLLGVAVWFAENPTPTEASLRLLRRWLWLTSFSAWFGQGNPSRYARLFKEIVEAARAAERGGSTIREFEQLPWTTSTIPFPRTFDFRSARARAWLCVMVRDGTLKPDGTPVTPVELAALILGRGPAMLRRVVSASNELQSSPANRIFDVFDSKDHDQSQARTLLRRIDVVPGFWEAHLLAHDIAGDDLNSRDLEERLRERQARMIQRENALLRELDLPTYSGDGDAPIDNDGEASD